jgi:hypothetical protein
VSEREIHDGVDGSHGVVAAISGLDRDAHIVTAPEETPERLSFEVQKQLAVRADDPKLQVVPAAIRAVVRSAADRPDAAAVESNCDCVMQLDRAGTAAAQVGEHLSGSQISEPEGERQGVTELGLGISAPCKIAISPGVGTRYERSLDGSHRAGKKRSGVGGHRDRQMLDLADASVHGHEPLGFDDHRQVVPAEGHDELALPRLCAGNKIPRVVRRDREGLLAEDVCAGVERRCSMLVMETSRTRNEDDVGPFGHHVFPACRRMGKAETVADRLQER